VRVECLLARRGDLDGALARDAGNPAGGSEGGEQIGAEAAG
jgi:hypothetical protein